MNVIARIEELRAGRRYAEARELARAATVGGAAVLCELGRLEEELGDPVAASRAYRAAWEQAEDPDLRQRAAAGLVLSLVGSGSARAAREFAARALADSGAGVPGVELLCEAGLAALELDDQAGCERLLGEALAAPGAGERRGRLRVAESLGNLRRIQGCYEQAESLLREALALAGDEYGADAIELVEFLNNLAVLFKFSGNFEEARSLYLRAVAIVEAAAGPDAPPLSVLFHNLGGLEHARRDFAAGEPYGRRSVEISAAAYGPGHLRTALDKAAWASLLDGAGRPEDAEPLFREAIAVLEREYGADHREVAVNLNNLAAVLSRRGEITEAEALYRRALVIRESFGPDGPHIAGTLNNLGVLLRRSGRLDEAEACYRRALDALEGRVDPEHPTLRSCRRNLERLLAERA